MNLDDAQRKRVSEWIREGLKLSEIQNRLISELGVTITYMEVRLLVDDLKLTPKDQEPAKPPAALAAAAASPAPAAAPAAAPAEPAASGGAIDVKVDQLARPGAIVSGKVTFSDGTRCDWYLDQTGRIGLAGPQPGYRPPQQDLPSFQAALDKELARMGF